MAILDLLQKSDDPKYPGLVLTLHVIAKHVEMCSMLGLAIGVLGGTVDFAVKKRNPVIRMLKMCELGICIGTISGILAIASKAHFDETMTADGIRDRAFRLVHSKPGIKHNMDIQFLAGGLTGAFLLAIIPENWVEMDAADRVARGYCLGAAVAALPLTAKVAKKMATRQLQMT